MNWFDWTLVAWWGLNVVVGIALIGRPRKPISPADAVGFVFIYGAFIAGLVLTR